VILESSVKPSLVWQKIQ